MNQTFLVPPGLLQLILANPQDRGLKEKLEKTKLQRKKYPAYLASI